MSRVTRKQVQLIQIARRQLGLDDADYREILRNFGHVASSKDLTQQGFEDVMAHLEHRGFNRFFGGKPRDHFRNRAWHRGVFATAREVHKIRRLVQATGYRLPGLCLRFSNGRTDDVATLAPIEAYNLIEMLKTKQATQGGGACVAKDGGGMDAATDQIATGRTSRTGVQYHDAMFGSTDWDLSQSDDVPF